MKILLIEDYGRIKILIILLAFLLSEVKMAEMTPESGFESSFSQLCVLLLPLLLKPQPAQALVIFVCIRLP